jgi:hypothetical protein
MNDPVLDLSAAGVCVSRDDASSGGGDIASGKVRGGLSGPKARPRRSVGTTWESKAAASWLGPDQSAAAAARDTQCRPVLIDSRHMSFATYTSLSPGDVRASKHWSKQMIFRRRRCLRCWRP